MRDICSPRLKAWLKSSLVWNSDTKGNQASTATGAKITTPITYSYPRAKALTEPHSPSPFITGRSACDICTNHTTSGVRWKGSSLQGEEKTLCHRYLKQCPAGGQEGEEAVEDVAHGEVEEGEEDAEDSEEADEEENLEKPEHELEVGAELFPAHRHHLHAAVPL
ncbi:hypothetical protein GW17_00015875 [Ensete ventricosum]|nr:hypothetical protein GW17_00015875 [Ensete ventricosum]